MKKKRGGKRLGVLILGAGCWCVVLVLCRLHVLFTVQKHAGGAKWELETFSRRVNDCMSLCGTKDKMGIDKGWMHALYTVLAILSFLNHLPYMSTTRWDNLPASEPKVDFDLVTSFSMECLFSLLSFKVNQ